MYSVVMMLSFGSAPMEADYLLPRRGARVEARQMRRASAGCDGAAGAAAYSSGCSGGQAIQYTPAGCQGGSGGYGPSYVPTYGASYGPVSYAPPPPTTTFYYVPATAPQVQAAPNRPTLYFRQQQCPPGMTCYF